MKLKILLLLAMSTIIEGSALPQNLTDFLPEVPSGWKQAGEDKIYDLESLYDYINGGAELYISYGMKDVLSRLITNSDGDEIRVEIFDMMKSKNAFGVFSHTRTIDEGKYGQGSQYFPGTLIFWKGQYYVSIMATDENEKIRLAINDLAAKISKKITSIGDLPEIVNVLPQENIEKDGYLYFHHYIWLNSYYFIADENIFNINEYTDAILAKYGEKESRYYLLVIDYPDPGKANSAFAEFKDKFLDQQSEETTLQIEDGKWLGGNAPGNNLICVFNASTKMEVEELIEKTKSKTQP